MSKASFIKSDDRKYNIERCLSLLKSEIITGLRKAKKVVVKPSCIIDNSKHAATNIDALDAVLNFIKPYCNCQITLTEGVGVGETLNAFKNYGYLNLQEKYDFAIIDLNTDNFENIKLLDEKGKTWNIQIPKTILDSDYLISISPPKTHNEVIYAGAIKNVAIDSLLRPTTILPLKIASKLNFTCNNKTSIHQNLRRTNENIKKIFKYIPLRLAILDAYEIMEGNGPINGEILPAHFAVASSDPLAADWLTCRLMGINIDDVGYLSMLDKEDQEKNDFYVIGDDWQENIIQIKMHSDFEKMKKWKEKNR